MRILLNEKESEEWQAMKSREKILEETSRFPPGMKLPAGCKLTKMPLVRLTKAQKSEILQLAGDGIKVPDIATMLQINGRQVSGVIQGHKYPIAANVQAARQKPKVEGLQPMRPLVMPEAETPTNEPACSSCGKPLGRDKVAIGGQMYCCPDCAPAKVPTMIVKREKAQVNEELLEIVRKCSGLAEFVACHIKDHYGYDITPGKVSYYRGILTKRAKTKLPLTQDKRPAELRTHD